MSWTLYTATRAEGESSRLVVHTQQVLQAIAEIEEALSRADASQRGYLLTGMVSFIAERDQAIAKLDDRIASIAALTGDNTVQQQRVDALGTLFHDRVAIMRENSALREAKGLGPILERVGPNTGQRATERFYDLTHQLRDEELALLETREKVAAERRDRVYAVLNFTVFVMLLVLIPGYVGYAMQSRARRRSERNIRVMADSLPGAMYQTRHAPPAAPHLRFVSAGMFRIRGLPSDGDATRTTFIDQLVPEDRPRYEAAVQEAVRSLKPISLEYRVRLPDGSLRWMHHEATPLRDDDGSVLVNGYVSDVTERRQLEEALQEAREAADAANRAKSTFLATMSHEIRTPMNAVQGMLELLSLTRLDTEQRATLAVIQQSGRSLLRIIDDILDISKIEAGRLDVRPEPTSIADVVRGVHDIYLGNASSRGLGLEHRIDPRIAKSLMVDSVRLRQILSNLVSNAIKFTVHGSVSIAAELVEHFEDRERVRFSVTDTGPGIPEHDQKRLFQPFSQIESASGTRGAGTGLGLAICRRLASIMGGTVDIDSKPGRGTTMTVVLEMPIAADGALRPPVAPPAAVPSRAPVPLPVRLRRVPPPIDQAEREGTLVLLVDDHPTNLMLLERQVRTLGYAVETADDGAEALEKWKTGRFGLVLTDCNMPVMDGYELTRAIRAIEAGRQNGHGGDHPGGHRSAHVPIIACTANALAGEAEHCLATGMDDYLVKPATLQHILGKLDRWLPLPDIQADTGDDAAHRVVPLGERLAASGPDGSPGKGARPESIATGGADGAGASTPHADAQADSPVDPAILAGLTNSSREIEQAVLANFRRVNEDDAAALARAIDGRSGMDVARAAHRIKGACRMIGARALAAVAESIEQDGRAENWDAVRSNMSTFEAERGRLERWIDALPREDGMRMQRTLSD